MSKQDEFHRPWNGSFQFRQIRLPREVCGFKSVLRPYIPMALSAPGLRSEFRTFGLIDTGADFSMLPREVAEVIGIDVDRLSGEPLPVSAVGEGTHGKVAEIDMRTFFRDEELVIRTPFVVIVDPPKPGQFKDPIIGRHPLFHEFDFGFRMGFTDDPDLGKFTMRQVLKRRPSSRFKKEGPALVPPADRDG